MKARLDGKQIFLDKDGIQFYEQSGYGRPVGDGLRLRPAEALYLVYRNKIEIPDHTFDSLLSLFCQDSGFIRQFLVYWDIRERGYAIQTGPQDFRIFKRGHRPGRGESLYMLRVLSERELIDFSQIHSDLCATAHMRKQHLLGVVDDENEITYYEIKRQKPIPVTELNEISPATGSLAGRSVVVSISPDSSFDTAFLGKRLDNERLMLSPVEAVWLMRTRLLSLFRDAGQISPDLFLDELTESDPEMREKLAVYEDLRRLGYTPKTGYKFGHHFRVYSGKKIHSEMLVQAIPPGMTLPMNIISRSVRMAHSVRKQMFFACVQSEGIVYIEFARIKL
ncbi:MAG: tRNA-intron lyase [Methanospirillaceae archaeon]|nr:tRNA-intron lyase [Methanospirillaceae archaeon]